MAASDKTEKATPKKQEQARRNGQIARSSELNGAAVLVAALLGLSAFAPALWRSIEETTVAVLDLVATPEAVSGAGLGAILGQVAQHVAVAALPLLGTTLLAGIAINVVQTKGKTSPGALKPKMSKLNPVAGLKNLLGPNSLVEAGKGLFKVVVIGSVVALAVFPRLDEMAALVGLAPGDLLAAAASDVMRVGQRAALAYLALAFADLLWQKRRHAKSIRMDKQEVKDEFKQQELPAEVKTAQKRRALQLARARMMDAIPTADVVVTNPTHFSVALRYDASELAPVVVAKGQDHLAFRIREIARAAGVAVVPDPPLARTLYASVDVGRQIPEELFQAVAQLLAYVYRVAGRRAARGRSPVASEARQKVAA
jgi:flagellar biosynthetic protein FlhB